MKLRPFAIPLLVGSLLFGAHAVADQSADAGRQVTALADRLQAAFQEKFPLSYSFSGLPIDRHDGLDINSPADIERWQQFLRGMNVELQKIQPDALAGRPEWNTWHYLSHMLKQDAATAACREELWNVSPLGWQATLARIAEIQPVGNETARKQALERWRSFGPWIDQETANLREGQRQGFSATRAAAEATLGQLDGLLQGKPEESGFMAVARRDGTPAFTAEWTAVIKESVWPALERYRTYLREQYLPRARAAVSIAAHPDGAQCYRARIFAITTLDEDPAKLFEIATAKVAEEQATAVRLGREIYGEKAKDWTSLAQLMKADPRNRFASQDEVRAYTQATIDRAEAAAARMVLTPPVARVKIEPFPEFQQQSAPGGQYIPAADDGSRQAVYLYRHVVDDLYRLSLQNVILHETLPGHHLQVAFLREHGSQSLHPVARLLFFSGPGEGWATYSEDFAYELGLYDSDLDYIGGLMASITPMMVADLGMQIKGWSTEQAVDYLEKAIPMRPRQRITQTVALLTSMPGFVHSYTLGGIEWAKMRARAEEALGERFDVRAFHQVMLEDGMLPFAALEAKLDRWISAASR